MRGLARDPAARQATVMAFADAVEAGIAGEPTPPGGGFLGALKRAMRARGRQES